MAWAFDPQRIDIVWVEELPTYASPAQVGTIDVTYAGDLAIDLGDRSNTISNIDQGLRVIDGTV